MLTTAAGYHPPYGLRWMRVSRGALGCGWFGFMVVALGPGGRRDGNDDSSL
jgi:hypothetical protein